MAKPKTQKRKIRNKITKRNKNIPLSAQESIPFDVIFDNGLILNSPKNEKDKGEEYSLTFSADNANYLQLKDSDKNNKILSYLSFLNALPEDINYQENFLNIPLSTEDLRSTIIPSEGIDYDNEYDAAYVENNEHFIGGIREKKADTKRYFTLSYRTNSKTENPYNILLSHYQKISARFSEIGSKTEMLTTYERLELFHTIYNPFDVGEFQLPPDMYKKGTNIKDYICPSIMEMSPANHCLLSSSYSRLFFVRSFSESIDDEFLNDIAESELRVCVSKQVNHLGQATATTVVNNRLRKLEGDKQTRLARNAKNGTTYVPFALEQEIEGCKETLRELDKDQEMFDVGIYILLSCKDKDQLESNTKQLKGICSSHHISLQPATLRQEDCFNSVLPLASDRIYLRNFLLSSGVGMLLPFSYDRVFDAGGFFYGKNSYSKQPIVINRKKDKNANGFYLGKPGSGKSMFAKMEIEDVFYHTNDRIIVVDPEREFVKQCLKHNGTVIKISANTKNYVNPFDVNAGQSQNEDIVRQKAGLIQSLFEIFKNAPLTAQEISIIDRCVMLVYKDFIAEGCKKENTPTFIDFDKLLQDQPEKEICTDLHLYLETYITGSVNIFAHQTNVDTSARYIDFDLRDLGDNLRRAGMLIVTDFVQQSVFENYDAGLWTWIYIDEFQTFYETKSVAENKCAEAFENIFARVRKYGGIATGLTQNITKVLDSPTAVNMLQCSQFVVLFEQARNNLEEIVRIYDLSKNQASRLNNTITGEGVLVYKNTPYSFEKLYPKGNIIYDTITTSFQDKVSMMAAG